MNNTINTMNNTINNIIRYFIINNNTISNNNNIASIARISITIGTFDQNIQSEHLHLFLLNVQCNEC